MAFAEGGGRAASAGYGGTVRIWDMMTGKEIRKSEGNLGAVKCIAFSPDGEHIAELFHLNRF